MVCTSLMDMLHFIQQQVMAGGGLSHPWVTDLGAVGVDCSGSINFTQFTLHVSKSQTHVPRVLIRKDLDKYKYNLGFSYCNKQCYEWIKHFYSYPEKVLLHTKLFTQKNKSNWASHILSQVGKFCKLIIKIEKKISSFIALLHSKPCNLDGSQLI